MADPNDSVLLREYAERQSESAFSELVRRHVNFVYSVAMRYLENPPDAQDVAQAVFVILAQKSAELCRRITLTGWLYEATRLTARQLLRTKARRLAREQEAYMQSHLDQSGGEHLWRQIAPYLEDAMSRLRAADRELLALRFYENKTGAEAAALLGIGAAAAHKRTSRALEKLQSFFAKRGVNSTAAAIAENISTHSIQAAPVALAKTVTAVALAKGAAASTSTLTLIKGALKIMAWTKAKTAIVAGAIVLLAAGTTTVTVNKIRQRNLDSQWDTGRIDTSILDKAPRIVRIIPSRFPNQGGWARSNYRIIGIGDTAAVVVEAAYGARDTRTILLTKLPQGKYDFISNLPSNSFESLKKEISKQFGVVGRAEVIETNVLFLKEKQSNAPGLKPTTTHDRSSSSGGLSGEYQFVNEPVSIIANLAENSFGIPVIDQTGLKRNFDVDLKWDGQNDPRHENLKQAIADQLGLELVPGTAPVEMLVVEKAK